MVLLMVVSWMSTIAIMGYSNLGWWQYASIKNQKYMNNGEEYLETYNWEVIDIDKTFPMVWVHETSYEVKSYGQNIKVD